MSALASLPTTNSDAGLNPLRHLVRGLTQLVEKTADEFRLLSEGGALLRSLVERDDWLPSVYAAPNPNRYSQYLLYRDPQARFSVVSFVWGPGQQTPIHDHTVWGLVGVLRGSEIVERYDRAAGGLRRLGSSRLGPGEIDELSPHEGDIHRVSNGVENDVSVSIHVYGADIGSVERTIYEIDGKTKPFVSRYADAPNLALGPL